jgi:hypothetical protein
MTIEESGKATNGLRDPVLSPREACEELGISIASWKRHWRWQVPIVRLSPGRVGVRRSVLIATLEARTTGGR